MLTYDLPELQEEIIEIEMIDLTKPKEKEPEEKKPKEVKEVMTKVAEKDAMQLPSSVEKVIEGKIKELKLGEKFTPPPPLVSMPEVSEEPTTMKSPVTFKKYIPPESIEKFQPDGSARIGSVFGKQKNIPLPKIKAETKFHIKKAIVSDSYKAGAKNIVGKEPEFKVKVRNLKLGLAGEIINRGIDSRPDIPPANIDVPTTVTLDFEVQPDGTVVKIKPQVRVDVNLERIAIAYLKKWKFSNLPMDAAQKNQNGTLVVRFELE